MDNVSSNIPMKRKSPFSPQISIHDSNSVRCKDGGLVWWRMNSKYYNRNKIQSLLKEAGEKWRIVCRLEIMKIMNFILSAFNITTFILYGHSAYIAVFASNKIFNQNRKTKNMSREVEILQVEPPSSTYVPPHVFCYISITIRWVSLNIIYS